MIEALIHLGLAAPALALGLAFTHFATRDEIERDRLKR